MLWDFGYIGTWMASPKYHFYFLHSPLCKSMLCLLVLITDKNVKTLLLRLGKTLKSNRSLTTVVERDTWRTIFFWTSCSSSPNLTHARKEITSLIQQLFQSHVQQWESIWTSTSSLITSKVWRAWPLEECGTGHYWCTYLSPKHEPKERSLGIHAKAAPHNSTAFHHLSHYCPTQSRLYKDRKRQSLSWTTSVRKQVK